MKLQLWILISAMGVTTVKLPVRTSTMGTTVHPMLSQKSQPKRTVRDEVVGVRD